MWVSLASTSGRHGSGMYLIAHQWDRVFVLVRQMVQRSKVEVRVVRGLFEKL